MDETVKFTPGPWRYDAAEETVIAENGRVGCVRSSGTNGGWRPIGSALIRDGGAQSRRLYAIAALSSDSDRLCDDIPQLTFLLR